MKSPLPSTLLSLLSVVLPALSHASPQPPLVSSDWEISLIPRHTLFLRQLSNLQTFEQALGGARASAITNSGDPQRPFSVDGSTFDTFASAAQRSCDNQFQACQAAANGNGGGGGGGGGQNRGGQNNGNGNNGQNGQNGQNGNGNGNGNRDRDNNNNNNNNNNRAEAKGKKGKKGKRSPQEGGNRNGLTVQQCDQQKSMSFFFLFLLLFSLILLFMKDETMLTYNLCRSM